MGQRSHSDFKVRESSFLEHPRILVIEDSPFWQTLLRRTLEALDSRLEIVMTSSGAEAIQCLKESQNFDLVLSDQKLEGLLNGLDVYDRLRENEIHLPYVIISGIRKSDFYSDLMENRNEMIPGYIEKSSSVSLLRNELREILRAHRLIQSINPRNMS